MVNEMDNQREDSSRASEAVKILSKPQSRTPSLMENLLHDPQQNAEEIVQFCQNGEINDLRDGTNGRMLPTILPTKELTTVQSNYVNTQEHQTISSLLLQHNKSSIDNSIERLETNQR